MSGADLFTPGRHFNKQRIQQGAQTQSINQADMLFELQTYTFSGLFWHVFFLLTRWQSMLSTFQLLAAQLKYKRFDFHPFDQVRNNVENTGK